MKWLALAWRNVARNRRRSFMAGGIIAFGAATLVIVLGFMLAISFGLGERTIHSDVGHIQIAASGGFENNANISSGLDSGMQARILKKLRTIDGVRFAMRRILFDGLLSNGNSTIAVVGRGVEPMKEWRLSVGFVPLTGGASLGRNSRTYDAVIGNGLATKLDWRPNDSLTLIGTTERGAINSINAVATGAYTTGTLEKDSRSLMVPLDVARTLLDTDKISRIVVVLQDAAVASVIVEKLRSAFPEVDVRDWKTLDPTYQQSVTLYQNTFIALCAIILAVIFLSITNTMTISDFERVKEIETMRVIGFSRIEILAGFSLEGAIIGIIGASIGLGLAVMLSLGINLSDIHLSPAPGRTSLHPVNVSIEPVVYLGVSLLMMLCGLLGALISARSCSRIAITQALGHH